MNFIVVGTNHKHSPIEVRERISFSKRRLRDILSFAVKSCGISSCLILSTCNRVEIYARASCVESGIASLKRFISRHHEIPHGKIEPYLYEYIGKDAMVHLCEVASGLDSQVLGETQILDQLRAAYKQAKLAMVLDKETDSIFRRAIYVGGEVRRVTKVSQGNVSIGSVAMSLVGRELGSLTGKRIMIIGVGKISGLLAKYLSEKNAKTVFVSNRTFDKAEAFAHCINGEAVKFDRLKEKLKEADVVISATSSPHIIIRKEDLLNLGRPLLVIDLALPRDIDPAVKEVEGIKLFDLDDLSLSIEEGMASRKTAAGIAKRIIREEAEKQWIKFSGSAQEKVLLH